MKGNSSTFSRTKEKLDRVYKRGFAPLPILPPPLVREGDKGGGFINIPMKLIVGLGNPGRIYAHNRHNTGFMCLSHFAKTQGILFDKKQSQARIGAGKVAGDKIVLARPQTYMNLSGQSVSRLIRKFDISLDNLIVVHDDLDLPLGKIRIRQGGGSGGHRGIDSIISCIGDPGFLRIRIGVGRPDTPPGSVKDREAEIIDYVLSDFAPAEEKTVAQVIPTASQAILCLLNEGLTAAMNKYNQAR